MLVSVIIPTFGRAEKLARCLERLARQDLARDRFEVLVGVDGKDEVHEPDDEAAQAVHALAKTSAGSMRAVIHEFNHAGPGQTRNRLVQHAHGSILLFLNDDVLPEPDLLSRHAAAHAGLERPAMVLGAAPWVKPREDTMFDRLVRETSMIFFYDQMDAALAAGQVQNSHDWGFRHAWTLNLSLPRPVFDRAGGFDARMTGACYEDLEFAWRAAGGSPAATLPQSGQGHGHVPHVPVIYQADAVVHHDHRILPEDYLRREQTMGAAAWEFAAANPACAKEVFGRDIRSDEELEYSREFVVREQAIADRQRETLAAMAAIPAESASGPGAPALLRALYEQHLLLKRWTWRTGLLEAAAAGEGDG